MSNDDTGKSDDDAGKHDGRTGKHDDDTGKDDEHLKMECRDAAYRAGRVHEWLEPLLKDSVLKDRAAAERPYAFKDRTKSAHDIYLKVLGRRSREDPTKNDPNYKPNKVTDASGMRIVKLFNAEVPQALDELLSFLKLLKEATEPTAKGNKLLGVTEIEFHTSRRPDDPLSIFNDVQKVVAKHGYALEPPKRNAGGQGTASSYSSVHVLVECEVKDGGDIIASHSEIQLRSVFEEAWSEISHRLKYAREKNERASGPVAVPDNEQLANALLHLDALKSLTDGCAQYADLINKQIKISIEPRADRSSAKPLDPPDERSADKFARYGAAMREAVKRAYDERERAVAQKEADARAAGFRAAAELFEAAINIFKTDRTAEDERLFDILREEFAYCSMLSGNEELRRGSEKIYRELLAKWPKRVSVLLRLGQLRRDAGDFVEAEKFLAAGLKAAEESPDSNPEVQRRASWVLRRDLAYVQWRLVDFEPSSTDAVARLRRAIELSEEALRYAETEFEIGNTRQNYLYYVIDLWNRLPEDQKEPLAATGKRLLNELRPKVDLEKWSVASLDTMARGEAAFGDPDRAVAAAEVVARKLGERIDAIMKERQCSDRAAFELMSRDEHDMYLHAQRLLATIKLRGNQPERRG